MRTFSINLTDALLAGIRPPEGDDPTLLNDQTANFNKILGGTQPGSNRTITQNITSYTPDKAMLIYGVDIMAFLAPTLWTANADVRIFISLYINRRSQIGFKVHNYTIILDQTGFSSADSNATPANTYSPKQKLATLVWTHFVVTTDNNSAITAPPVNEIFDQIPMILELGDQLIEDAVILSNNPANVALELNYKTNLSGVYFETTEEYYQYSLRDLAVPLLSQKKSPEANLPIPKSPLQKISTFT